MNDQNPSTAAHRYTIVLTGANSGIGLEACKILCMQGHTVIGTVRSQEKGDQLITQVKAAHARADISYLLLDVASVESVRAFVNQLRVRLNGSPLNVLINNAGLWTSTRQTAPQHPEWELTMATDCIGPILLTELLLDDLKKTASQKMEARVVMVNSSVILPMPFLSHSVDFTDIMLKKPGAFKNGAIAYKNAKLAFMMATLGLVDELASSGDYVKIVSICPGAIPGTGLQKNANCCARCCFTCVMGCLCKPCFDSHDVPWGGQRIVDAAVGEQGNAPGKFFVKGTLKEPPAECLAKENQRSMLNNIRELTGNTKQATLQ